MLDVAAEHVWRGERHLEPPAGGAVPALDQMRVACHQFVGRLARGGVHAGADRRRDEIGQEGLLFVFDDIGLVERHRRAHAAVAIGFHHGVDRVWRCGRHVESIVENARDAELQHLDGTQGRAQIGKTRTLPFGGQRRHFVQHEHFERIAVEAAAHEIARRMHMRVDEAGHGELAARVERANACGHEVGRHGAHANDAPGANQNVA